VATEALEAAVSTAAALFEPTKGDRPTDAAVVIEPNRGGADRRHHAVPAAQVVRPTPAARPQEVSFAIGIASSSSPKGIAVLKGPKTSSRQIRMSLQASRNIVGARKNYDRMGIHPIAYE